MNTYPLTQTNKDQEQTIIKEILKKMDINNQLYIVNIKKGPRKPYTRNTERKTKMGNIYILRT
jgi:hypothetical protein